MAKSARGSLLASLQAVVTPHIILVTVVITAGFQQGSPLFVPGGHPVLQAVNSSKPLTWSYMPEIFSPRKHGNFNLSFVMLMPQSKRQERTQFFFP